MRANHLGVRDSRRVMDAGAHPPALGLECSTACPSRTSMNGDAGALAYNHSVKTSEAQYGDIHTIHTVTFAERFSLQRAQARLWACSGATSGESRGSLVRA